MACRSYPADTRLQSFFAEGYERERDARMKYYLERKRGAGGAKDQSEMQIRGTFGGKGLPQIDPRQFAISKFRKEKEELEKYVSENRLDATQMMYKPKEQVKELLYDGFSKEGKGRASYLRERKSQIPEKKYEFPVTSSWNYGWKLDECFALKRPAHARSSMIRDNFFTRNGVPTMREPNFPPPHGLERSVTCANINM